jgi:hypothetical protein
MYRKCSFILVVALLLFGFMSLFAQEPPHPPTTGHGMNGNQSTNGSARITDGIGVLVAFAIAYGYQRMSRDKKAKEKTG